MLAPHATFSLAAAQPILSRPPAIAEKGGRAESEFGDGASSTVSLCGRSSAVGDWDLDGSDDVPADEFADSIEWLYEKRASTREAGLSKIVGLLTAQHQLEECLLKQETLARLLLSCLKKGAPTESALASRCLGELHAARATPCHSFDVSASSVLRSSQVFTASPWARRGRPRSSSATRSPPWSPSL
jgi:hypothetical protein